MQKLIIHSSNYLEILIEKFLDYTKNPLLNPLKKEIIVIQSKGMERWISLKIAQKNGICANIKYIYPNNFLEEIFSTLIMSYFYKYQYLSKDNLSWIIFDILLQKIDQEYFLPIKNYLIKNNTNLNLYQLSKKIADIFDQYLIYRPEMILEWEKNIDFLEDNNKWQVKLWQEIIKNNKYFHKVSILKNFSKILKEKLILEKNNDLYFIFPKRIAIFGISILPSFYMQILSTLSHFVDIHLFLMNPCREYWGDILSNQDIAKITKKSRDLSKKKLYLNKGNTLLASMGISGRDFFETLYSFNCIDDTYYVNPKQNTLLSSIQSDILYLKDNSLSSIKNKTINNILPDSSLEINSCHSQIREIEILHNYLLKLFETDKFLAPKDILVMAPNIKIYSNIIDTIFSLHQNDEKYIPFCIADKNNIKIDNHVVSAFLNLINFQFNQLDFFNIILLLEKKIIRKKFLLKQNDIKIIFNWIKKINIKYELNLKQKKLNETQDEHQNIWKKIINCLMLGFSLMQIEGKLFNNNLPFNNPFKNFNEKYSMVIISRFITFINKFYIMAQNIFQSRTLNEWSNFFLDIINNFFVFNNENLSQKNFLFNSILELKNFSQNIKMKIELNIIQDYFNDRFNIEEINGKLLSNGITFSDFSTMRNIPFKIICLIGMNDNSFPRNSTTLSFNIVTKEPKFGDKSKRLDDKYMFLETLISARKKLYISYIGYNIQDNTIISSSPVITELLFYLKNSYGITDLTKYHMLQSFNPQYFNSKKSIFFSYSKEDFIIAKNLFKPRKESYFFRSGLLERIEKFKKIFLDDFCAFFINPAKFILNYRLGIKFNDYTKRDLTNANYNESYILDKYNQYKIENYLLNKSIKNNDIKDEINYLIAKGYLPSGTPGISWFDDTYHLVKILKKHILYSINDFSLSSSIKINFYKKNFNIFGEINNVYTSGHHIDYRLNCNENNLIKFWIIHVILNHVNTQNLKTSIFYTKNIKYIYKKIENSSIILNELLNIYWQGLIKPIPFFPKTSWKYAESFFYKNDKQIAYERALKIFEGNDFTYGEKENPYINKCFPNTKILLKNSFHNYALKIIYPIIKHLSVQKYN